MTAFRRAAEGGFGIETDLRTSCDGVMVLFHDRCVRGAPVDRLTQTEISRRAGRVVPSLEELLDADLGVPFNLEVKTTNAWRALKPRLDRLPASALLSSFIHRVVEDAAASTNISCAHLVASSPGAIWPMPAPAPNRATIVWDYNVGDDETLRSASSRGFRNIVYGPVTVDEHERLQALGCAGVITDFPDRVRQDLAQ